MADKGFSFKLKNCLVFHCDEKELYATSKMLEKEIFLKKRYERAGWEIKPNDTVVDIGANMGFFLLWAAPQAKNGRLLGIEPSRAFDTLSLNLARNQLNHTSIVKSAVASREGEVEMHYYPGQNALTHVGGMHHSVGTRWLTKLLFRGNHNPIIEKVPSKTLPAILEEQGVESIDFLKIDCEGAEYDIFDGIPDQLFQRINKIALEYHELKQGHKVKVLVDRLERVGFDVQVVSSWFSRNVLKVGEIWAKRKQSCIDFVAA